MNIAKKVYCRIFQGAFKLAIPVLPYRNPMVLSKITDVADMLKSKNINSVLLVTDKFINESGLITPLKDALIRENISFFLYDKTVPNPTVNNVEEARALYAENKCTAIIGIGGGSAIDCAKAVGARIAKPKKPISKMEGILSIIKKTPLTIAILTTAGTGSETTVTTVITDDVTHHKFPISDFPLIPDVAVLDPEITVTLPPHLTATTGMDALVHAVEAYIGRSTVKSTRKDAESAVRLIFENLDTAYSDGSNISARNNMLKASHLAGRAFSKSYVGYCHAVAHSLGGKYNIPHGLANAVIIPYVLKAYGSKINKKLKRLSVVAGIAKETTPDEAAAKLFVEKIEEMNKNMNIPSKLSGIKKDDIKDLSVYADKEANPLYPVPVLMNAKELEGFYYDVLEE